MRRAHGAGYTSVQPVKSDALEEENENLVEGLKHKTAALKSLTIDMGHEIREQKGLLSDLDNEFDRTGGFLSSTVNRVSRLIRSGHYKYLLYLAVFSLFVFFVIYAIIKTR